MKLKPLLYLGILFIGLLSCSPKDFFWDISKFVLDENALEDNEKVSLIYWSGGPDYNEDRNYFFHVIGISQSTGDTVNILTPLHNGLSENDKGTIFTYFSPSNVISKSMLKEIDLQKISKVARDPNFDHIADNKYPSVIGIIGTTN